MLSADFASPVFALIRDLTNCFGGDLLRGVLVHGSVQIGGDYSARSVSFHFSLSVSLVRPEFIHGP